MSREFLCQIERQFSSAWTVQSNSYDKCRENSTIGCCLAPRGPNNRTGQRAEQRARSRRAKHGGQLVWQSGSRVFHRESGRRQRVGARRECSDCKSEPPSVGSAARRRTKARSRGLEWRRTGRPNDRNWERTHFNAASRAAHVQSKVQWSGCTEDSNSVAQAIQMSATRSRHTLMLQVTKARVRSKAQCGSAASSMACRPAVGLAASLVRQPRGREAARPRRLPAFLPHGRADAATHEYLPNLPAIPSLHARAYANPARCSCLTPPSDKAPLRGDPRRLHSEMQRARAVGCGAALSWRAAAVFCPRCRTQSTAPALQDGTARSVRAFARNSPWFRHTVWRKGRLCRYGGERLPSVRKFALGRRARASLCRPRASRSQETRSRVGERLWSHSDPQDVRTRRPTAPLRLGRSRAGGAKGSFVGMQRSAQKPWRAGFLGEVGGVETPRGDARPAHRLRLRSTPRQYRAIPCGGLRLGSFERVRRTRVPPQSMFRGTQVADR